MTWFQKKAVRRPSLGEIGDLASVWFRGSLRPVRRHVETIAIESASSGTRKATIDILLPRDGSGSTRWRGGLRLYYLPAALLRKTPPALCMDFTREDGRTLPILNRLDNAEITWRAVSSVTQDVLQLSGRAKELMDKYLRGAIFSMDTEYQAAYVAAAIGVVKQVRPDLISGTPASPRPTDEFLRLRQLWKDVAAHSVLWLGLAGTGGERRVLRFSYHVPIERPPLWPRRARSVERELTIDGEKELVNLLDLGDANALGVLARIWKRLATTIGWAAYDIAIDTPYLRRSASYHLQVKAPEGTEIRGIELGAWLVDARGNTRWPETYNNREWATLYFAELRVKREGPAEFKLRVGRRGFLTYAAGASVAVAVMLWFFHRYAATLANHEVAAVPVLLVVPALLALFILRPGEHALASHMLSGARAVILADALICACATAALGGALPFGWSGVAAAWHAYAVVATVLAGALLLSWVLALDSTEVLRRATWRWCRAYWRYTVAAGAVCLLAAGALWEAPVTAGRGSTQIAWASALFVFGLTAGWLSQYTGTFHSSPRAARPRRVFGAACLLACATCVLSALLLVEFDLDLIVWSEARHALRYAAIAAAVIVVLIEPSRRIGLLRPIPDEPELWIADSLERGAPGHGPAPEGSAVG